ncbi:hypothetical protein [Lentisalinibacter salinarum]|uniref:hypothetical protein n=1 Tax=Lentisalinibacter salinarum TaxID=2992239 RepID=UPI00386D8A4E
MKTNRQVTIVLVAVILGGCASLDSASVRSLTEAEIEVLGETRARLAANRSSVNGSLDDLADNIAYALRQQHRLESNIAKAQLLEAMKSPWTTTLESSRKEVALYHLFALEEAEQKALAARIESRNARIAQLKSAYAQLVGSMSALIAAQEQLLVHLDQPASTQISLVLQQVVEESQAFREALEGTDDPRLQRVMLNLVEREQDLSDASDRIVELLKRIEEE